MKKRYDEVLRCRGDHRRGARPRTACGTGCALRQLYHDREEVTGLLLRSG